MSNVLARSWAMVKALLGRRCDRNLAQRSATNLNLPRGCNTYLPRNHPSGLGGRWVYRPINPRNDQAAPLRRDRTWPQEGTQTMNIKGAPTMKTYAATELERLLRRTPPGIAGMPFDFVEAYRVAAADARAALGGKNNRRIILALLSLRQYFPGGSVA